MSRPRRSRDRRRHADRNDKEAGIGSWLWIHQGRGRTGILLPPQWHRRRLRWAAGWREGFVRNRVEPQGPARQERPHRLVRQPEKPRAAARGFLFFLGNRIVRTIRASPPRLPGRSPAQPAGGAERQSSTAQIGPPAHSWGGGPKGRRGYPPR